ncbi:MAG: zinc-ribbon domain-containing protein [Syntrophales bacterium]|nr:zinc-ribbon domain-containing protein [Syntrophales bacterium]MDD5234444.1 zinc-ribbon domain-containing protein [Syntrophales bacterium]
MTEDWNAKRCGYCNSELMERCPHCGAPVLERPAIYCGSCGAKLRQSRVPLQ